MTQGLQRWLLPAIVVSIVLVAVIAGLLLVDSPARQRMLVLDRQREFDLRNITLAISRFFELRERLPQTLDELSQYPSGFPFDITDPETGTPYEYRITNEKSYELCAVFSAPTPQGRGQLFAVPAYRHDAGRQCFNLTATSD